MLLNIVNSPCNLPGDKLRRLGCIFSCGVQQDELSQQVRIFIMKVGTVGHSDHVQGKQTQKYGWRQIVYLATDLLFNAYHEIIKANSCMTIYWSKTIFLKPSDQIGIS